MDKTDSEVLKKYSDLLSKVNKDQTFLTKMLKDTISQIELMEAGRVASQKFLSAQK
jgi:hypothetical protein